MKKTKIAAKETPAGAELRRRARVYEADAERAKADKDAALALRQEGRADGYLDAATFIDEYLAKHKPGEELPDAGDVADLAMMQRADSRLDDLERRVVALEHASPDAIKRFQEAWNADPKERMPPSLREGGLLAVGEGTRKAVERHTRAKPLTNGAPPAVDGDDDPEDDGGDATDYDLSLLLAFGKADPKPLSSAQAALVAGFSPMSGTLAKGIRRLRNGGLIAASDGRYTLTRQGDAVRRNTHPGILRKGEGLLAFWSAKLGEYSGSFLMIFTAASPKEVSHEVLADKSGFSKKSGSFAKALRRLRRMHLLEGMKLSREFAELLDLKA